MLAPRPLRTGRETFTSSGSSLGQRACGHHGCPGTPAPAGNAPWYNTVIQHAEQSRCRSCSCTLLRQGPLTCPRCECPLGSHRPHQRSHGDPPTVLLCLLKGLAHRSRAPSPEGSGPAFAWGDVACWLNPYPPHYRAAFAFSFTRSPQPHRLALRRVFPEGGLRAYHVPHR